MVLETQLYFESHVTIEPVFDDECFKCFGHNDCISKLQRVQEVCKSHGFKLAELLMQKRRESSQDRSKDDTFCTGRSKSYEDIHNRMVGLIVDLKSDGFKVWRYKIEDIIMDSKQNDILGLL